MRLAEGIKTIKKLETNKGHNSGINKWINNFAQTDNKVTILKS